MERGDIWQADGSAYDGVYLFQRPESMPAPSRRRARLDTAGVAYAAASAAITSGIGYAIWYTALPHLRASTVATLQLSVPVIAALGGIPWLGEPLTLRLVLAASAILSGIALVIRQRC